MDTVVRRAGTALAWMMVTSLLWGAALILLDGFDAPAVMVAAAVLAGLVASGVVAGAVCWLRGHHLVGSIGLLAPVFPAAGHSLALAFGPSDVWAPTMAGDLLGMASAIAASLVAVVGAWVSRDRRTA